MVAFFSCLFEDILDGVCALLDKIRNPVGRCIAQIAAMGVCSAFFVGLVFLATFLVSDVWHITNQLLKIIVTAAVLLICLLILIGLVKLIAHNHKHHTR